MMTAQRFKELERAFRAFDRSTAYYCAVRGEPFDQLVCERLRVAFWTLTEEG